MNRTKMPFVREIMISIQAVKLSGFLLFFCFQMGEAIGQSQDQIRVIRGATDTIQAEAVMARWREEGIAKGQAIRKWAASTNSPMEGTLPGGVQFRLIRLDTFSNGSIRPIYYETQSREAAIMIRANRVWLNGGLGLGLTGTGIKIGLWDFGRPKDHTEYGGRVFPLPNHNALNSNYHATHITGTMIATGIDANARGMANGAEVGFADFDTYDINELAEFAIDSSGIVSNHSYGLGAGWNFGLVNNFYGWHWYGDISLSSSEDYYFGLYTQEAREWDSLTHLAPYYLICKSADNNRDNSRPPGSLHYHLNNGVWEQMQDTHPKDGGIDGYDCIVGHATAKNILVVGAVKDIPGGNYQFPSDVVMTPYSGFGPTDDGRIKPDLVSNGQCLYATWDSSAYNSPCGPVCEDELYCELYGTSMATPTITGSVALLQEHYSNTHQSALMRSATVKALLIHCAHEAGSYPGPDFRFGWGLANIASAAKAISVDATEPQVIQELTLNNGGTISLPFNYNGIGDPFVKVTMVWTDPPGIPTGPMLDPTTPMLVNDLDIRIIDPNGVPRQPWVLNNTPGSEGMPATQGDNTKDNVEQVIILAPGEGMYTLQITHKGILQGGAQDFSIVVSGLAELPFVGEVESEIASTEFQITPNPSSGMADCVVGVPPTVSNARLEIFRLDGTLIFDRGLRRGRNVIELNAEGWPSGLYTSRLTFEGKPVGWERFVVAH